jgi:hypothetical protein
MTKKKKCCECGTCSLSSVFFVVAILLQINCNDYSCVEGVWIFKFEFLMLVALAISHLLMPATLTLLDYHYPCLWLVRNINKSSVSSVLIPSPGMGPSTRRIFLPCFELLWTNMFSETHKTDTGSRVEVVATAT